MSDVLSPESEKKLRALIREANVSAVEDLIIQNAMECATLSTTEPDDYSQTGNSRYGGLPDLPVSLSWPQSRFGYLAFLMQINLADVPPFAGKRLPDSGLLYFFADDQDAVVLYSDETSLVKTSPPSFVDTDREGNAEEVLAPKPAVDWYDDTKPYHLAIRAAIDLPEWTSEAESEISEALETSDGQEAADRYRELVRSLMGRGQDDYDGEWAGKLGGAPCWIGHIPDWAEGADPQNLPDEEVLLALLNSNTSVNMMFGDAGYILLYAPRAEIEARTFGCVTMEQESS